MTANTIARAIAQPAAGLALLLILAPRAWPQAEESVQLVLEQGSRLWLEGSSNVHEWSCTAAEINAEIQLRVAAAGLGPALPREVSGVLVQVPVKEIRCGNGRMDQNLWKTLKAAEHPVIEFRMSGASLGSDSAGGVAVAVEGDLTIAGVTRSVELAVRARDAAGAGLRIAGSQELRMTDFGVKPPTAMFGALKTADLVVVRFELVASYKRLAALLGADTQSMAESIGRQP